MLDYLSVKNLPKYQHYKKRNPPWVKLHRNFWMDDKIDALTVPERLFFLGCLTIASEHDNRFKNDPRYLSKRLGFPVSSKMIEKLLSLTLLCSVSDSDNSVSLSLSLTRSKHSASSPIAERKHIASTTLADRTSKGLTSIASEVTAIADKHFPPI